VIVVAYFLFMFISAFYSVLSAFLAFYPLRPQKVSVSQVTEPSLQYPKITLCSPAFFDKKRLEKYGLDDESDSVANYLILSLQIDQMSPALSKTESDYEMMENRIDEAMSKHNISYLQLLRNVAVTCDEFILFVREKKYNPDFSTWPKKCGEVFLEQPILTSFGTCFISNPNYELSTTSTGFIERMTILLSTYVDIDKDASWLNDEALRSGVFFSLSSMDHHVNSLAVDSLLLSPATSNLIAMKKRRIDRTGFSEDSGSYISKEQVCREKPVLEDQLESSIPFTQYNGEYCKRKKIIQNFEKQNNCSMLALFGTTDLISDKPICKRDIMQQMMPLLRDFTKIDVSLMKQISEECPRSCHEEFIDTQMSFTSVSEESHNRAWKLWPSLPQNRTKDDALFMELFYKTLEVEVTKVEPSTFFDLLSSIGGTLGLFLGGSIFSLFEFLLVAGFFSMSMLTLFLRTALNIKTD